MERNGYIVLDNYWGRRRKCHKHPILLEEKCGTLAEGNTEDIASYFQSNRLRFPFRTKDFSHCGRREVISTQPACPCTYLLLRNEPLARSGMSNASNVQKYRFSKKSQRFLGIGTEAFMLSTEGVFYRYVGSFMYRASKTCRNSWEWQTKDFMTESTGNIRGK